MHFLVKEVPQAGRETASVVARSVSVRFKSQLCCFLTALPAANSLTFIFSSVKWGDDLGSRYWFMCLRSVTYLTLRTPDEVGLPMRPI